jgi:hypothetical protein
MWFRSLWNLFVGEIWKSLEMWSREALECLKQSLMGDFIGNSEDHKASINADSKCMLMTFQMETRTLLGIELEGTCVPFWHRTYLHFVCALRLCVRLSL